MKVREIAKRWEKIGEIERELRAEGLYFPECFRISIARECGYTGKRKEQADDAWLMRTSEPPPENWVKLCTLIQELKTAIGSSVVVLPCGKRTLRLDDEFGEVVENDVYQDYEDDSEQVSLDAESVLC